MTVIIKDFGKIKFLRYPNNESYVNFETMNSLNKFLFTCDKIEITFLYNNDSDLIHLMLLTNHIRDARESLKICLNIAYMPYSRMDRNQVGNIFSLKHIVKFIENSISFDELIISEPHSNVTMTLFNPELENIYMEKTTEQILINLINDGAFNKDKDIIVFPDLGAARRYSGLNLERTVILEKARDFTTGKILSINFSIGEKYLESIDKDAKVWIIDDLVSYGGTFVSAAELIRDKVQDMFLNINLVTAHSELSCVKGKLFDHIDTLYTTDSMLADQKNNWVLIEFLNKKPNRIKFVKEYSTSNSDSEEF